MKKFITILIFLNVLLAFKSYAQDNFLIDVITALESNKFEVIDSAIKSLGIEKGARGGFKKYQIIKPSADGNSSAFILALSWDPSDGYLLYIDKSGRIISSIKTGYIISLGIQEIDRLSSNDILIANVTAGYGSGYQEDTFILYSICNDGLKKIWEGISYQKALDMQGEITYGRISFINKLDKPEYILKYNKDTEIYFYNKSKNEFIYKRDKSESKTIQIDKILKEKMGTCK